MHWPKSSNMTKTCYHHMLFVGGVGFYSKITFLTPLYRSKVIRRSKSYDKLGQGQWSCPPSLIKIGQVMTELQRDWQKKEERILQRQNKTACLPSCKKEETSKIQDPAGVSGRVNTMCNSAVDNTITCHAAVHRDYMPFDISRSIAEYHHDISSRYRLNVLCYQQ